MCFASREKAVLSQWEVAVGQRLQPDLCCRQPPYVQGPLSKLPTRGRDVQERPPDQAEVRVLPDQGVASAEQPPNRVQIATGEGIVERPVEVALGGPQPDPPSAR